MGKQIGSYKPHHGVHPELVPEDPIPEGAMPSHNPSDGLIYKPGAKEPLSMPPGAIPIPNAKPGDDPMKHAVPIPNAKTGDDPMSHAEPA